MTRTNQRALANWPNNAVSVLDYGAVGDGVTNDSAAFTAALAATAPSGIVYVPDGQYRVTIDHDTTRITGPGKRRYIDPVNGFDDTLSGWVTAGDGGGLQRQGEQRTNRNGGLFIGDVDEDGDEHGVVYFNGGHSAFPFLRERSEKGNSILYTIQNGVPWAAVTVASNGTTLVLDRAIATQDNFVFVNCFCWFNNQEYRVKEIFSDSSLSLKALNNSDPDPTFTPGDESVSDTLVFPRFYTDCKGNVSGNVVTVTGGQYPAFANYLINNQMAYFRIGGQVRRVEAQLDTFVWRLAFTPAAQGNNLDLQSIACYDYTTQHTLKRVSGQGGEETWKLNAKAGEWRTTSSGSGSGLNRDLTFWVGDPTEKSNQVETFRISKNNTTVTGNLTVTGRIQDAMESVTVTADSQTVQINNTITQCRNAAARTGTIFVLPALSVDCSFKIVPRGELTGTTFTLPAGDSWGNDPGTITLPAVSAFCLYYVASRTEWYYST